MKIGFTYPPEAGAKAYMNKLNMMMLVTPTYAAAWRVLKLPIVVWIMADK